MRQHFSKWIPLYLLLGLALYVATVEMRPGRLYFLLNYLLFEQSLVSLFLYLLCFGLCLLGLLALLFNRNKVLFSLTLFILAPCLLVSLTYRFISGYNFMYSDAVMALNNLGLAGSATFNYALEIISALATTFAVVVLIFWLRRRVALRTPAVSGLVFPIAAAFAYGLITWSTGVIDDFPALYRVPLSVAAALSDQLPQPKRKAVPVSPSTAGVPHLFLVVDESITATELSLHNPLLATTPYLLSVREQLLDFGIASSFTNQSGGSNISLMSGTRLADLPDQSFRTLSRSNIFQFAQRAGYTTYYIDAQQGADVLQNFMSPEDLAYIDHVERPAETHPTAPYYERDMLVAQRLAQLSQQPRKVFAYVLKAGAHWPYGRTYPPDSAFFTPALSPRSFYKDRERTRNTYHNALRWTVDEFWRRLMQGISPQDSTVVVYTSDHGQNLTQSGIRLSHGSVHETSPLEAAVPLWMWDPSGWTGLSSVVPPKTGGYSHGHIFPTLLLLQGYQPAWVNRHYGHSLLQRPTPTAANKRFFLSGDLFGRGPHSLIPFVLPVSTAER